jgi:hypothetical protein
MSTLQVGTIKSASSAPPVFQNSSGTEKGQLAKCWINYNGGRNGSFGIRDSFGVSSITDNGAGDHDVNWSISFSAADYCVVSGANFATDDGGGRLFTSVRTQTTSKIQIVYIGDGGGFYDSELSFVTAFGDN